MPNAGRTDSDRRVRGSDRRSTRSDRRARNANLHLAINLAAGVGEGPTELSAFDAALRATGVANFNLIALSSVIPPGAVLDVRPGPSKLAEGSWGDRLYVVMAQMRASEPGIEAWAGIGWVQDTSGKGLFVEHEGHSREEVEADIEASLRSLCAGRRESFGPIQMVVEGATCVDTPVCALVIAAFESEGWSHVVVDPDIESHSMTTHGQDLSLGAFGSLDFWNFAPDDYLAEYYTTVGPENDSLLRFLAEASAEIPDGASMLEFGCGPTLYQLVSAASRVAFIDVADRLFENLRTIETWKAQGPGAWDWTPFIRRGLELEGLDPAAVDVETREGLIRQRIRRLLLCDAFDLDPLMGQGRPYDVVGVNFVAESITADHDEWRRAMTNICGLVAPGGRLIMSALEGARGWKVGTQHFPAVELSIDTLVGMLRELGFAPSIVERTDAEVLDLTSSQFEGYTGLLFASARREHARR
jgi:arginine decarboxylase